MTQTIVSQMGEPNCPAILAGFIKTPEPIILPIMSAVADQNPIFLASEEVVGITGKEDKHTYQ